MGSYVGSCVSCTCECCGRLSLLSRHGLSRVAVAVPGFRFQGLKTREKVSVIDAEG